MPTFETRTFSELVQVQHEHKEIQRAELRGGQGMHTNPHLSNSSLRRATARLKGDSQEYRAKGEGRRGVARKAKDGSLEPDSPRSPG